MSNLKKEQDDLLVLLADQDSKIRDYRRRLQLLGQSVTDDDDEEDDDDEDDSQQHHHRQQQRYDDNVSTSPV